MKALPFKIPHGSKSSIKVDHDILDQFYPNYHTHEEIQLTLVVKGRGIAYIGDQILEFDSGDIFLLGGQLPHVFKDEHFRKSGIESFSIFFLKEFLGRQFLDVPENRIIEQLLSDTTRGIKVSQNSAYTLDEEIKSMLKAHGFDKILRLLGILNQIAHLKKEFITGHDYRKPRRQVDGEKINNVFNFLTTNYTRDISLAEVADIAHMSPTAFCRYFKQHTRKSYSRFLNEIRVSQACTMLQESAEPISRIAFSTGFNNISNFNRQFKRITGTTPSAYQNLSI